MKQNTINIPGYSKKVSYNTDFGAACTMQDNYKANGKRYINFWNRTPDEVKQVATKSTIAVWHIKQRH